MDSRCKNVLSGVCAVVHKEELDILGVSDDESLETVGHHVTGGLVAAIADLYCREKITSVSLFVLVFLIPVACRWNMLMTGRSHLSS